MMDDDEKFFAWLDGELAPDESAQMEARLAADPRLAQLADQHRAMAARLDAAFATIAEEPVPDRLLAQVRPAGAEVIDFPAARSKRPAQVWPAPVQWAAMAATLALGVICGTLIRSGTSGPAHVENGRLYASTALGKALETQLASAPADEVRIGLTFRDKSGVICRSFTQPAASGLACREGQAKWQLRGLFAAPEGQAADYRMAAGMDPGLANLIDVTMAGEPLDAAQEQRAKQAGWR